MINYKYVFACFVFIIHLRTPQIYIVTFFGEFEWRFVTWTSKCLMCLFCFMSASHLQHHTWVFTKFSLLYSRSSSTWLCSRSTHRCRCLNTIWPPTISSRISLAELMLAWWRPWTRPSATSLWLCSRQDFGTTRSWCSQQVCFSSELGFKPHKHIINVYENDHRWTVFHGNHWKSRTLRQKQKLWECWYIFWGVVFLPDSF